MNNSLQIYNSLKVIGEEREYRIYAEEVMFDDGIKYKLKAMEKILNELARESLISYIIYDSIEDFSKVIKIRREK